MDSREVVTYTLLCFVSILAVVNPIRAAAASLELGSKWTTSEREFVSGRAVFASGALLFLGGWVGNHLLIRSGIHLGGFRVAGSLLVLITSLRLLLHSSEPTRQVQESGTEPARVAISPLAFPLLASAPALATVTMYSGETSELWRRFVALGAMVVCLLIAYAALRWARQLRAFLGMPGELVVQQVLALSSAAWAVDFLVIGVRDLLPLLTQTTPSGQ